MRSPPRPKLMTFDEPFSGSYFVRIFVQEFHNTHDIHMMYHRSNSSGGLFTEERMSFVKEEK